MDITHQYYNEIVLAFSNYETDFREGTIIIFVPDDKKPFDIVVDKIKARLDQIAEQLEPRDKDVAVRVQRADSHQDILLRGENHDV